VLLFVSGYTDDTILQRGVLHQGTAFLQKPFTTAPLARMLHDVLDAGAPGA
jgi:CheY-like chemotaxis protein